MERQPPVGQDLLIVEASRSYPLDTAHSVGFLRSSDQPVAGTCIFQHTTLTRHSCPPAGFELAIPANQRPHTDARGQLVPRWPAYTLRNGSVNPLSH